MEREQRPPSPTTAALRGDSRLRRFEDVREMIGNPEFPTPMVRLRNVVGGDAFPLFLKLEWFNPFGSVKDRTAKFLLEGMAARGELDGKQIVEPSSGNTGIALAALAAVMGKKIIITIPDGVPEEKKILLRMFGAEVWATPDDLCPIDHPKDGAIALAHSFINSEGGREKYAMPNQYENADNVRAHYETTGPEIWKQTEGEVKYFIAGYGTCGTLTGTAKYLKEQNPAIRVIAIEPRKGHRLPGLKNLTESKVPGILDPKLIDEVIRVEDEPAYAMTKQLIRQEGLMVGPTTGAIVHAAAQYGIGRDGIAVAISPDSGLKYTTFFSELLGDEGLPQV